MTRADNPLEASWQQRLAGEFKRGYMLELRTFLRQRKDDRAIVFPHSRLWFHALNLTAFDRVRVVVLGQDPYHGPGQAHGLCFSVPPGVPQPPSLVNIFRELQNDLGLPVPDQGNLESWAHQGVLLLNSVLTVEQGRAGSHANKGWETFTDSVIAALAAETEHSVFMLWGSYAQRKGEIIDRQRHLVLECPHPSPLSASRGFFGCSHFSQANDYLQGHGRKPIDWSLPPAAAADQKPSRQDSA